MVALRSGCVGLLCRVGSSPPPRSTKKGATSVAKRGVRSERVCGGWGASELVRRMNEALGREDLQEPMRQRRLTQSSSSADCVRISPSSRCRLTRRRTPASRVLRLRASTTNGVAS